MARKRKEKTQLPVVVEMNCRHWLLYRMPYPEVGDYLLCSWCRTGASVVGLWQVTGVRRG
jgi:hypothetical protein